MIAALKCRGVLHRVASSTALVGGVLVVAMGLASPVRADELADLQKCYQDVEDNSEVLARAYKSGDQEGLADGLKQTEDLFEVAMRLVSTVSGGNNKAMASKCATATQETMDFYRPHLNP